MNLSSVLITERQQEILDFVSSYTAEHGFPPVHAEITEHFKFKSSRSTGQHLIALRRKGFITREPGKSRTLHVLSDDERKSRS